MPDLFVQRGDGLSRGPDVVDPLLTTVDACLARGRAELDENAHGLQEVDLTVVYRSGLFLGQIVQVNSPDSGLWYAKIVGIQYQATVDDDGAVDVVTSLSLRRPSVIYG